MGELYARSISEYSDNQKQLNDAHAALQKNKGEKLDAKKKANQKTKGKKSKGKPDPAEKQQVNDPIARPEKNRP